ncbi:M56 family metallopeptidase [Rufibacter sp. DG15C]|uniref:M56 family metallopeptidase n=1 Tax=Rufibacter sp. DG15C TaxID=1379909 RepID=UPI000831B7E4|nr:M56 family metallopeptidase [Rufibacter sp. DG15C]
MMEYLLKVSLVMAVGFLFYKLVLQQESFFATNRFYLLCCLVLAFAFPFVNMPQLVKNQGVVSSLFQEKETVTETTPGVASTSVERLRVQTVEPAASVASQSVTAQEPASSGSSMVAETEKASAAAETSVLEGRSWGFWLAMFYVFGVAIFCLNLLFQLVATLWKVYRSHDKVEDGDYVIINTAKPQAPCSFFKYIFIHPDSYDFDTYEQIIAHEKIHVRLGHTLDLLLAELAVVVLWFNPLAWLYKREVEKNIEYQTDAILLGQEQVSPDSYQMSLLQIACPQKPLSITTNYNQSLLKQRICMMNAKKSTPHAFWKYAFLAPLFFGTLLVLNEPATSHTMPLPTLTVQEILPETPAAKKESVPVVPAPKPAPQAASVAPNAVQTTPKSAAKTKAAQQQEPSRRNNNFSINNTGGSVDMSEGYWYGHTTAKEYCVELKGNKSTSTWNMSRCFDKSLIKKTGADVFIMTREAGTQQFNGKLDEEVSQGKYTFTPNNSFVSYLNKQDINTKDTNQNLLFFLFLGDVSKDYVGYLKSNYGEVSGRKLEELAIHGVTMDQFKQFVTLFQKHNNSKPSISEVIEARIHGISENYVKELQALGYKDVPLRKMMEAKIHGVSSQYVEGLKQAGYTNLSLDKVISAKIHGVTTERIKELKAIGGADLTLDKAIEMRIHGVTADYIKDLSNAGYSNLTLSKITEAKIHGVNSATIKALNSYGFKNLSINQVINAKIHGVNGDFLQGLEKEGFKNLSIDKAVEAKIHGVTGDFIKEARKDGYNLKSLDEYINVKIMGYRRANRDRSE